MTKDYILEIAHKKIDSQIKKSENVINKQSIKKSSARPINVSKELLISKI